MKTFSSAYAGSPVPGSLEFGGSGHSGASFIPCHMPSDPCVDPTQPCLLPLSVTSGMQPQLSVLGFKLGMGLLWFCWEIPLRRLKSHQWGLLTSWKSVGSLSRHSGAGAGWPGWQFPCGSLLATMVWWGAGFARGKDQLRSH